jgi:putative ABC transport system permease protein
MDLRFALTDGGEPEEVQIAGASASLFPLLGVRAGVGRLFDHHDDRDGGAEVVVLAHDFWRRRFGGSTSILGRAIRLDGRPYTVIGVLPASFGMLPPSSVFPAKVDAWVPLQPHLPSQARDVRFLHAVARIPQGVNIRQANDELASLGAALSRDFAPSYPDGPMRFQAVPMRDDVVREVRPALILLAGLVGLVLAIACANVAALQLARGHARQREMAIRVALGASRGRLVRQLLAEGAVLAVIGGAAGLALAMLAPIVTALPVLANLPRFADMSLDSRFVIFALGVSTLTALVFALAPVLQMSRGRVCRGQDALRMSARSTGTIRIVRALAIGEVALASSVLVAALALAQAFARTLDHDPGFTPTGMVTMRVSLPPAYQRPDVERFYERTLDEIRAVPGVTAAAAVTQLPLSGTMLGSTFLGRVTPSGERQRWDADLRGVTPDYFLTMGIQLVAGRTFGRSDLTDSPAVAVVDETFANRVGAGRRVIGQQLRWIRQPDRPIEIVGLVRAVRHRGLEADPRETVYLPHTQYAKWTMFLTVRVAGDPAAATTGIAAAVHKVDASQPLAEATTLDALVSRSVARPGFGAGLGGSLATLALALAAVGTYGLFAFAVSQRVREMAVRLAIGATPAATLRLVLRDGLFVGSVGLGIGLPLSAIVVGAARTIAFDDLAVEPWVIGTAAATLLAVVAGACWLPARRAASVQPAAALRAE